MLCCGHIAKAQADSTIGVDVGKWGTDYQALASAICLDQPTERDKANAIYNWVTHHIAYDVKALWTLNPAADKQQLLTTTLKNKKAICSGYAHLYEELCKAAGLSAVSIDGYAKDWVFDNGDKLYIPRHEWNAVRISGNWQLVDVTWGAGYLYQHTSLMNQLLHKLLLRKKLSKGQMRFRQRYDPQYFMQDPETFRLKHLPADPLWQLTDSVMPIAIFEAGDSAIRHFNQHYSQASQSSEHLNKIAMLSRQERTYEYADRAYSYNNRFSTIQAIKLNIGVAAVLNKAAFDTTLQDPKLLVKQARNSLVAATKWLDAQKKTLPEYYNSQKKKNKAKSLEARQHIRALKTDDKKLVAKCKRYDKKVASKSKSVKQKTKGLAQKMEKIEAANIDDIATSKAKKDALSAEMETLRDTIARRSQRATAMQQAAATQGQLLRAKVNASQQLLDTMISAVAYEDSIIKMEATERLRLHDSYDDEVRKWSQMLQQQKYTVTDSLLTAYFANFDTIVNGYQNLQQLHTQCLTLATTTLKTMEQYKRATDADPNLSNQYQQFAAQAASFVDSAHADADNCLTFMKTNRQLFGTLTKVSKRQLKIIDYMERAEKSRQQMETSTLARRKQLDLKENQRLKAGNQKAQKSLDKIIRNLD